MGKRWVTFDGESAIPRFGHFSEMRLFVQRDGTGYKIDAVTQPYTLLQDKREAIADICARFGVERLEMFGSALREDFDPAQSDLDLLVQFNPMEGYAGVDAYFGLREALQALLGREIDLVMASAVKNKYISREIERTKQLVYAA